MTEDTIRLFMHHVKLCSNATCRRDIEGLIAMKDDDGLVSKVVRRHQKLRPGTFKHSRVNLRNQDSTFPVPDATNARYDLLLEVQDNTDLPGAGKGI